MKYSPMNRRHFDLFDDFFDGAFTDPFFSNTNRMMRTDISEKDGNYILDMELPGYKKEDVNIELKDGYLNIKAAHNVSDEERDNKGNVIRQERYSGSCSRSFYVGDAVTHEDIKAKFDNGILTITVPNKEVKEVEGPKTISIE